MTFKPFCKTGCSSKRSNRTWAKYNISQLNHISEEYLKKTFPYRFISPAPSNTMPLERKELAPKITVQVIAWGFSSFIVSVPRKKPEPVVVKSGRTRTRAYFKRTNTTQKTLKKRLDARLKKEEGLYLGKLLEPIIWRLVLFLPFFVPSCTCVCVGLLFCLCQYVSINYMTN